MRRKRRLLFGFGLLGVALAVFLILDSSLFRVQEIAVSGNKTVSSQEIVALTGIETGAHFFSFKAGQVALLVQQNPWISRAEISRAMPGKVRVSVRERIPIAAVPHHNGFLVVDNEAHIVDFVPVGRVVWPIITGWEAQETVVGNDMDSAQVSAGLRCISQLSPAIASQLSEINVDSQGDVVVFLMGGLKVFIGQADAQVAGKFGTLESMLEDFARNKMDVAYVDLRYDRPVVKLKTGASRSGAGVK